MTLGRRGVRRTVGIPGTGLYYTSTSHNSQHQPRSAARSRPPAPIVGAQQRLDATAAQIALSEHVMLPSGPRRWIGWGIGLFFVGLLAIGAGGVGVVLMIMGVVCFAIGWQRRSQPKWQAVALVRQSRKLNEQADAIPLLAQALLLDPGCAPALFDLAQDEFDQQSYVEAARHFRSYLTLHPDHLFAQKRLAESYLRSSQPDEAIPLLLALRNESRITEDSRASLTAALAAAYIDKKEYSHAVDLASAEIGQRRILDIGQQQCLHARATASYLGGQRARGLHDLDRLFGINPDYPAIQNDRDSMATGTFGSIDEPMSRSGECGHCGAPRDRSTSTQLCKYCGQPYVFSTGAAQPVTSGGQ